MVEFVIHLSDDISKPPLSMEEFILTYLNAKKGDEFVHTLFSFFNRYRASIGKKNGLYSSFRAIVSMLNKNQYIKTTTPNRETPFAPSKYRITDRGVKRLLQLQNLK